jgi:uncharacterized protein YkwD
MTMRMALCAISMIVLAAPALAASAAELISQFRAQHSEGKVTGDATLNAIAQAQATAMAAKETLEHEVAGSFTSRVARANAGRAAENIAYGYSDFPRTLKQWIDSSGHRRNLLLHGASRVGVANAKSAGGRTYWAMVIAGDYEKPKPKAKPSRVADKSAGHKPHAAARPTKRNCTIRLLGLCI